MSEHMSVVHADFDSGVRSSLKIRLNGLTNPISLFSGSIERDARFVSDMNLKQAISILMAKSDVRKGSDTFSPIFGEMLSDLIKVQRKREATKKDKRRKLADCIDPSKLEKLFEQNYDIMDVRINTIDINCDLNCGWRNLTLTMKFREVKEDG